MKLVCSDNIFSYEVSKHIYDLLKSESNYLYLTSSPMVNSERIKSNLLSSFFNKNDKIFYFEKFLKLCSSEIYNEGTYISNVDVLYILNKIIENYFKNDNIKQQTFKNMDYDIFKLYKFLIFNNVPSISPETLNTL